MKNSILIDTNLIGNNKIRTAHFLPGTIYHKYYSLMRAIMIPPITLSINIKRVPNET